MTNLIYVHGNKVLVVHVHWGALELLVLLKNLLWSTVSFRSASKPKTDTCNIWYNDSIWYITPY